MRTRIFCIIALVLLYATGCFALDDRQTIYGKQISQAMKELAVTKTGENFAVLTNANYSTLSGKTTEQYVDTLASVTGRSIGARNLLLFNKRSDNELITCLVNRDSQQAVVLRFDGTKSTSGSISLLDADLEKKDSFKQAKDGIGGKESFSIITILKGWLKDAPHDLIRDAEYHNHICPGLIYGYMLVKEYQKIFPLEKGQEHFFIASPNRCKDDAVAMELGLTPGSKNIIVKKLSRDPLFSIPEKRSLGVLINWSQKRKKGSGAWMALDWEGVQILTGASMDMKPGEKILVARDLLDHLSDSSLFIQVEKSFAVDALLMEKLSAAGFDPYEQL